MAVKSLKHSSLTDNVFYRSMLAGNAGFVPSDEDVLDEIVLTSTAASVTFSGLDTLAAGYEHLQVRYVARTTRTSATSSEITLNFNSDVGSNYAHHRLFGDGSSVQANAASSQTKIQRFFAASSTSTTSAFGAGVIDILDFSDTSKNTTVRGLSGMAANANNAALSSGLWINTSAITDIEIKDVTGANLDTNSRFTLIGLK